MMRLRYALLLAAVLLAASAIAGVAQPQLGRSAAVTPAKTITVNGHGTVATVPDRASFSFTVDTRAQTAAGALGRNADRSAAVVAALKNAVADAGDKAKVLASAAGLTLGGAQTVVEGGGQMPIPFAAGAKADSSVAIEPGTQTIEANVT